MNNQSEGRAISTERVGKELTPVPPRAGAKVQAIVPQTVEELKYIANLIRQHGLAPDSYDRDTGKIALGIMKGAEVGLAPLTALQWVAIINNRATIWGDGAIALVQASGTLEKMTEVEIGARPSEGAALEKFSDDYGFEVKMWRRGQSEPYVGRFTVGDAKRAKLWGHPKKAPWMLYPKRMLRMRAVGFPIRNGFADCLSGMMIREEVEDIPAAPEVKDTSFLDDDPKSLAAPETAGAEAETENTSPASEAATKPPEDDTGPFCHAFDGTETIACDSAPSFVNTLAAMLDNAELDEDKAAIWRGNIDGINKVMGLAAAKTERERLLAMDPTAA